MAKSKRPKSAFTKPIIFKIQTPIVTNDPEPKAFVYDKHHKWEGSIPLGDVKHHMGEDIKAFFLCTVHHVTGMISIGKRVDDPGW